MSERRALQKELDDIQQLMKDLEIRYEQYFAGVEKREPVRERKDLARRLRHYTSRRIIQTDLKFRYHGLASRFSSYCQYWDRILRLIDEGRYYRHTAKLTSPQTRAQQPNTAAATSGNSEVERLHRELSEAHKSCGLQGEAPSRSKIAAFLDTQREKIRQRYGDKPLSFSIDISDGKPRIKVSLKN